MTLVFISIAVLLGFGALARLNASLAKKSTREVRKMHGLLNRHKRPPLLVVDKRQMLETLFYGFYREAYPFADRFDADRMPPGLQVCYRMAELLYWWRGLDRGVPGLIKMRRLLDLLQMEAAEISPFIDRPTEEIVLERLKDDELRSLYCLYMYVLWGDALNRGDSARREQWLRDVEVTAPFIILDLSIRKFAEANVRRAVQNQEWVNSTVAVQAQTVVEVDSWIDFLKAMNPPDIYLWHQIATAFQDLRGDMLQAVFWILRQPACDRATAHDFIAGFVSWDILHREIAVRRGEERLSLWNDFCAVIERWNNGFYQFHSISSVLGPVDGYHGMRAADIGRVLSIIEVTFGLPCAPRPELFDENFRQPRDAGTRSKRSKYVYDSIDGLKLRGEGLNPA